MNTSDGRKYMKGPYGVKLFDGTDYQIVNNNMMAFDVISRVVDRTGYDPAQISVLFELPDCISYNKHHAANLADLISLRIFSAERDAREKV